MTFNRLLITGAAGTLGHILRGAFAGRFQLLRLSDRSPLGPTGPEEEAITCDLADAASVRRLCEGVDAIVHLGGIANEAAWPELLQSNIAGVINLYEGARKAGVERVIFASSNHATGMYPNDKTLSHETPPRPDSRYGLTKAFGE